MLLKSNKTGLLGIDSLVLKPGVNQVDGKAWESLKKHPTIQTLLDEGEIEEVTEGEDGQPGEDGLNDNEQQQLAKMQPLAASKLVKDTADERLLKGWSKNETRPSVKKALAEQLKALKAEPEMRKRNADGSVDHSGKAPAGDQGPELDAETAKKFSGQDADQQQQVANAKGGQPPQQQNQQQKPAQK